MAEQDPVTFHGRVAPEEAPTTEVPAWGNDRTMIEFLTLLAYRKRLVGAVAAAATIIGLIICILLPTLYTASARIMTPQETASSAVLLANPLSGSNASSLEAAATSRFSLRNPNDIYIGLLKSRPVADAIILEFGLKGVYGAKDLTGARNQLAANTLAVSESSGLIAISVTDKDKNRAAAIANAYPEQLRALTKTIALTEASQRRLFFEEQLKRANDDLVAAEFSLQQYQQKKGLVQLGTQTNALITELTTLRAQSAVKRVELQALRSYSTDHNPEVQLLENQLASLQGETDRLEQHGSSSASADLDVQGVAGDAIEYLRSEHELQYRQTIYDLLVKQCDAARLDEAKDAAIVQVVEPAIPPDRRSSPHRASIVFILAILGFLGISSYLYVRDMVQRRSHLAQSLAELRSALYAK
jgi:tyrosine-protein kinase Etk/Wzc